MGRPKCGVRGTVTFLFTDIEGSTRLLKELGPLYGDALSEHQRILRASFAAHGGREVDTQGDSFFVAFTAGRSQASHSVDEFSERVRRFSAL